MATKDYYKTLGVSEKASADELKKAYRKLAKKYHPDVTGGDKAKEAKFKEISEAYETVGDEKKRAQYDELRHNPFAGGMPGGAGAGGGFPGGGAQGFDINDLFSQFGGRGSGGRVYTYTPGGGPNESGGPDLGGIGDIFEMFRGGAAGAGGATRARAQSRRGQDVVAKLEIDLPDAALGAEKTVTVDGKQLKVKIPAGVTGGKTIRLAGQGEPAPARGAQPGDLLIELHERPHPKFRRRAENPADIEVDVPVPLDVAVLGGKAPVLTLEGSTVNLSIPAGSSSGRKLRLKEKG
ncbi:MAG TPA: DnaJ C-terminal domain-containing protein, partial [Polyangia bacterium]|nr:DnaJ C-terminal domain-containing protein [Polyangia bacterium]